MTVYTKFVRSVCRDTLVASVCEALRARREMKAVYRHRLITANAEITAATFGTTEPQTTEFYASHLMIIIAQCAFVLTQRPRQDLV